MASSLKICFAASEASPWAKTGGLADVAGALPVRLHRLGHDVRAFLPFYGSIDRQGREFHQVDFLRDVRVEFGARGYTFRAWTTAVPRSDLPLYLIDCPELFHRDRLYTQDADEPFRFALFSRAVLECVQRMGWAPDVIHCNDWHTALIPLLLRSVYDWDALFKGCRTLLTIHNLGYQGVFPAEVVGALGLSAWSQLLDQDELKAGRLSFLRTGLLHADFVSTVSPTYAREIQTEAFGMGLSTLLAARRGTLVGILNGVDYETWSPEHDARIRFPYSAAEPAGKRRNKRHLLGELGLGEDNGAPLAAIISRLAHHKGFDLTYDVLPRMLSRTDLRLVVLGSGESEVEAFFRSLQAGFPGRVCFYQGYSEELAHLIEAGADMLLMPSRYEPCGLNQLFSLRYGTIPIVRKTGGLADSVEPFDQATGRGTGFVFEHFTPEGLDWALGSAIETYRNPAAWARLVANAMSQDFSWDRQADRYVELYAWLLGRERPGA